MMYEPQTCAPMDCYGCHMRLSAHCDGEGHCPEPTLENFGHLIACAGTKIIIAAQAINTPVSVDICFARNMEISHTIGELVNLVDKLLDLDPCPPGVIAEEVAGELGVETTITEGGQPPAPPANAFDDGDGVQVN